VHDGGKVGSAGWWSLAFAPALLFLAVALLSGRRDRVAVLAAAILVALVVIDALLISIVTSNLLA
jgi:hypothetical protein